MGMGVYALNILALLLVNIKHKDNNMQNIQFHDIANIFPLIHGKEFVDLKADIKKNGVHEPIVMYEGQILDGRNRFRACQEVGIQPEFVEYGGDNAVDYVVSLNLFRRHLTSDQRAAAGVESLPEYEKEAKKRQGERTDMNDNIVEKIPQSKKSRDKVAETFGTNGRYVSDMKKLKETDIESFEAIKQGEKKLTDVKKQKRKEKQLKKEKESITAGKELKFTVTEKQDIVQCDALITDPPYGILDEDWDNIELEQFTREWLLRWNNCGADIIISSWSQRHFFDGKKWFDEELSNYTFQQLLIWHYPNNKSPQSRLGFKHTFEPIYFYRRKESTKEIGVGGGEWGDGLNDFDCHVSAMPQSNFNNENMKQHPAQKSLDVMRWLVNATTRKGDLVVDPFCGSGTTGIACKQLGREFYGIEINNEYKEIAIKRIATYG